MFLLIIADFEKSLQVSLSSEDRWTGLQQKMSRIRDFL